MDANLLGHRCLPNLRRRIGDIGDGHPAQERYTRLLKDGDTLSYQGNSEEVGCYVAGHPLSKGNCYFEVTIVDTGVRGTIAVGLVHKFYRLDHQPGWLPYSVAYHADNGKLYNGNPVGQQFGPKCARGDRIGCGIYPKTIEAGFKTVFFTKNGKEVGSVDILVMAEGLFPAVGMHSMGEEVKVDLQAEWLLEEDDTMMMVDSHDDDWGRLYDVRVSGTLLEYIGKGKSIMDVGLAQARQPLTTRCHYYEVEIVDAGEKCYIALGLARKLSRPVSLPPRGKSAPEPVLSSPARSNPASQNPPATVDLRTPLHAAKIHRPTRAKAARSIAFNLKAAYHMHLSMCSP
ncbi:SPRY domain-containing protein 3 isoform X2 [Dunckerocampus dactyliophorus]|uniref:SPRY domain-containing protein 3 isoform X2 n=1 Tax=Dunckerocampus dactyliophorus TaxID=161453 RepID=UPI002405B35D|nr:SPRY domain-containing protein 3 isoform X2 [Dunckerocampus dactyliophorus]